MHIPAEPAESNRASRLSLRISGQALMQIKNNRNQMPDRTLFFPPVCQPRLIDID